MTDHAYASVPVAHHPGRVVNRGLGSLRSAIARWSRRWSRNADAGRFGLTGGSLILAVVCLRQAPGRLVGDTKFDLVLDPARFLGRAIHLWEPTAHFGFLQNQAAGYLFPVGPFFWLGSALHVPGWIVQRSWLACLLIAALTGFVRMTTLMGIGRPRARLFGGLLYALAPAFMIMVGTTSAALLAGVCTPWILGSLARWVDHPRRAAMRGGVAVLFIGGTNATSALAALVLPTIFILFQDRRVRWRLLAWWPVAVGLASLWWLLPLAFQARYGFDFLPYTERAGTTLSTMSAVEMLRGTGNWLGYLGLVEPWSRAGDLLVHNPAVVAATMAVALAGMVGLVRSTLPHRRMLATGFVVGVLVMGSGYAGAAGGPLGSTLHTLLDGPLGFARNVSKFDPTLRIVLLVGLVHLMSAARIPVRSMAPRARAVATVATVATVAIAAVSMWPALSGRMVPSGSFSAVPSYWKESAEYLRAHGGDTRSLLVPTSSFAEYTWGRPLDEPLQGFGLAPWATRNLIPFGGPDNIRFLDGVEDVLATGRRSAGLPETLTRAGVRFVVVRNDLDWRRSRSPRPTLVRSALVESGFTAVAHFGRVERAKVIDPLADFGLVAAEAEFPAVEIYESGRAVARATAYPIEATAIVSGGPESVGQLASRSLLDGRAAVLARDVPAGLGAGWAHLVTDTGARQNTTFGIVRDNESYVLQAGEKAAGRDRTLQYGFTTDDAASVNGQTTATLRGVATVTASSYGSWLLALPEVAPWKALDGDPATAWVAERTTDRTPKLRIGLDGPVSIDHLDVTPLADGPWRQQTRAITVTTDAGSARTALTPTERPQRVAVPVGPTRSLVIALDPDPTAGKDGAGPGLREVTLPGVEVSRGRRTPGVADALSTPPTIVLDRWRAMPDDVLRTDPETTLDRTFVTPSASYTLTGTAVPRPGTALDALIDRLASAKTAKTANALTVSASSSWLDLPSLRPENLFDGNPDTVWMARPAKAPRLANDRSTERPVSGPETSPLPSTLDLTPTLTLNWPEARSLESVAIVANDRIGSPPKTIHIASKDGDRTVSLRDGRGTFAALRTTRIEISFPELDQRTVASAFGDRRPVDVPVGFSGLTFPGSSDIAVATPDPATPVAIGCDDGPSIEIDGAVTRLSLSGTMADLLQVRPLAMSVCRTSSAMLLGAGEHRLVSKMSDTFGAASMMLQPAALAAPARGRDVRIERWGRSHRTLTIAAGGQQILTVHENANRGWRAQLNGTTLQPVRVDGWQQGYVVPANAGGTVSLTFTPDRPFRLSLAVGFAAAMAVLALALVGFATPAAPVSVPLSEFPPASTMLVRRPRRAGEGIAWRELAVPIVAALVVGTLLSPVAGIVAAVVVIALDGRARLTMLGVALPGAAAGAIAAVQAAGVQPATGAGTFSRAAQILAAVAVAIAAGSALRGDRAHPSPTLTADPTSADPAVPVDDPPTASIADPTPTDAAS